MISKGRVHDRESGKIWPPVSLIGLHTDMFPVMDIVESVYRQYGFNPVLSAGTECFREDIRNGCREFIHSISSYHQQGRALDFSVRGIDIEISLKIQSDIHEELEDYFKNRSLAESPVDGRWYQVLFEPKKTHIHIELERL